MMSQARAIRGKHAGQEGYALVLVVFLLALVVIALATVTPNILINGRREKEEEMIWRGKQYVRGIRLFVRYYQMHGGATRFPTSMDDLVKNNVGIRFMRQAYKDPMNNADGSWRFIYVGPNGQLIGSLKPQSLGSGTPGMGGASAGGFGSLFGAAPQAAGTGGAQSSSFGNSSFGNSSFGNSSFGGATAGNSSFGNSAFGNSSITNPQQAQQALQAAQAAGIQVPPGVADAVNNAAANGSAASGTAANGTTTNGTDPQSGDSTDQMSTPQAIVPADVPTDIVGGNIIGVGSKVNQKSIIWYDKAKNYRQFEFVWDPSKEPVNGGANAGVIGIPPQAPQNGTNSIFSSPSGNSGFGQQPGGMGTGNPSANPSPGQGQQGTPDQPAPGQPNSP
jgi:hypothetical protein